MPSTRDSERLLLPSSPPLPSHYRSGTRCAYSPARARLREMDGFFRSAASEMRIIATVLAPASAWIDPASRVVPPPRTTRWYQRFSYLGRRVGLVSPAHASVADMLVSATRQTKVHFFSTAGSHARFENVARSHAGRKVARSRRHVAATLNRASDSLESLRGC